MLGLHGRNDDERLRQRVFVGNGEGDPEDFVKWLGPVSKEYWDRLNDFWSGKRSYV